MLGNQPGNSCIYCNESKIPSGNLENGVFDCLTCKKQYSAFLPIDWRRKLTDSFEPIFNASVNEKELYETIFRILEEVFNVNKAGVYLYDPVNKCIRLKKYSGSGFKKSPISKVYISTNLTTHPFISCLEENTRAFVKYSEVNTTNEPLVRKMLDFSKKLNNVTSSYIIPLYYLGNKLGVLSIDFESEAEFHKLQEKFGMIDFFTNALSISIHNNKIFNNYKNKYNQFYNLHSSGLTLNKLYMNNTQEIIKM
ncbi:MAG: hypothetical protein KDK36_01930, partial [Leptospiraceae bacterium]|nr:hypothetical protein [Leptospiraceae bacterium]